MGTDFDYGYIIVDKSKHEIAAVRQLVLISAASKYQLCYFYFLQEWERFVRCSESGDTGKPMQHCVLRELADLAHMTNP